MALVRRVTDLFSTYSESRAKAASASLWIPVWTRPVARRAPAYSQWVNIEMCSHIIQTPYLDVLLGRICVFIGGTETNVCIP